MRAFRLSIPVNFGLSFLKIRWSDHLLLKEGKKIVGEGVVYGGNWEKAEKLAEQMAKMNFGSSTLDELPVCEQIFISRKKEEGKRKKEMQKIISRGSNLKVKVGRNVFEDIKTLERIRNSLNFPNSLRIDANQGYSQKQLQYLIPTLKQLEIVYIEEPVKIKDLEKATELLHRHGLKIILDESLNIPSLRRVHNAAIWLEKMAVDAINLKLSRIGDINKAIQYIKLAKKYKIKVVIGCSEELERGMQAIYALGHIAKKEGVLLEIEGFGPLRLRSEASPLRLKKKYPIIPRWLNKLENLNLILCHLIHQLFFDLYWSIGRTIILIIKKTKLLSALSLRLVKLTGKSSIAIHPKHLIAKKYKPVYLKYINNQDTVLDVGCGNGQNTIEIAKIAKQTVGFDIDMDQLAQAQKAVEILSLINVSFQKISAEERLPFKNNFFSKALCSGVLEHLQNRDLALSEMWRVLEHKGLLFLGVPNETTSWKKLQIKFGIQHFTDPDHKVEYTRKSITDLLLKYRFKIKEVVPIAYDTPWAGLIDLIGGISLSLYEKIMKWKWQMAKKYLQESISFLIVSEKK